MKKYITWLFADFLYNLNEFIASKICLFVATTASYALFKNGAEIPNTRFEMTDPVVSLQQANPLPIYSVRYQMSGIATIDANANDEIELRAVGNVGNTISSSNGSLTASMNIEKVS